jgi:hypothetical protein
MKLSSSEYIPHASRVPLLPLSHEGLILAEGRTAYISGTVVDSLSGLGQQTSGNISYGNVSYSNYREAMTLLLTWGMRNFLILPSLNAEHLWESMSILDGPRGYDQK